MEKVRDLKVSITISWKHQECTDAKSETKRRREKTKWEGQRKRAIEKTD